MEELMIDIHSHILPNIEGDDGSRSLDMSLGMLKMAVQAGTTDIIATPHVNRHGVVPSWTAVTEAVRILQEKADIEEIPIHIYSGAEVELNYKSLDFLPARSQAYCLAESSYILVELTEQSQPDQTEKLLYELMLRGYMPILAHPERYDRIMTHPERVMKWMQKGVLTQCNAGSFSGAFGQMAQQQAEDLLKNHMIVFLGSDAHRIDWRSPDQRQGLQAIDKLGGDWHTCSQNGQYILQNKVLYPEIPTRWKKKKKGFWTKLFG
jgi:protein-tyrosine phosphatase